MTTYELLVCGGSGIAAGVLSGFLGIGGGAILPPLLVFMLGIEQHRAQGISLAAMLPPVSLPAVLTFRRNGVRLDTHLVATLAMGFVGGAAGGAWIAHRFSARVLAWIFAAFLFVSAWRACLPADRSVDGESRSRIGRPGAVAVGAAAGAMSGLLGIGGGLVALPLLRRLGLGRLDAQATTLAMMLPPIGLPAVYVYAKEQGGLPWSMLGVVAIGFTLGASGGARLAGKVDSRAADYVYALFLAAMAIVLAIRA
jgi:hypothetical protein